MSYTPSIVPKSVLHTLYSVFYPLPVLFEVVESVTTRAKENADTWLRTHERVLSHPENEVQLKELKDFMANIQSVTTPLVEQTRWRDATHALARANAGSGAASPLLPRAGPARPIGSVVGSSSGSTELAVSTSCCRRLGNLDTHAPGRWLKESWSSATDT